MGAGKSEEPSSVPSSFSNKAGRTATMGCEHRRQDAEQLFSGPWICISRFFFFFRKRILACWAAFLLNCLLQKSRGKHCSEGLWNESASFLRKPEVMSRMRLLSGEARRWLSPANNAPSLDPVALLLALAAAM